MKFRDESRHMTNVSPRILAPHVRVPATIRHNDYYRERYPDLAADTSKSTLSAVWTPDFEGELTHFEQAMYPYLADPFRGTVRRHILAPGETIRACEKAAAVAALSDAGVTHGQVDLLVSVSMWPDQLGFGNGLWLAEALELQCGAWNLETAQSGGLAALQAAYAFVASGLYKTVLVVASCSYSRAVPESSTFSWFLGDAAAAIVVTGGQTPVGGEMLSAATINTAESKNEFTATPQDTSHGPNLELSPSAVQGSAMRRHTDYHVSAVAHEAVQRAGICLDDIDFFVFSTPVAWFVDFATRLLGIDPVRTINTYSRYANVGPVLPLVNLYEALNDRRIGDGDLVLVVSMGSVSSATASVVRWHAPPRQSLGGSKQITNVNTPSIATPSRS